MHPRDMEPAALAYHIREALNDAFVIDFLSDRAQNSLINFLALELKKHLNNIPNYADSPERFWDWHDKTQPFFEKATKRHPLYAVFGDVLANAVEVACNPVFAELEHNANANIPL